MRWQPNDLVLILSPEGKRFLVRIGPKKFSTHHGEINLEALTQISPGDVIYTHKNIPFITVKPTLYDLIFRIKRITQIIYPKELGYILMRLGIGPGSKVIECGSGSGALTLTLAWWVRPNGRVYSYEKEGRFVKICLENLNYVGLKEWVELKHKNIGNGFDEKNVDAIFLDVKTPWMYFHHAWEALKGGCVLGILVPTTNQITESLKFLEKNLFKDIEIIEILLRRYKTVAERLRPEDRMVAHTGYLIFARKVNDK